MKDAERNAVIRSACKTFINTLIARDVIDANNIFVIMSEEATKLQHPLCAEDKGIHGTHIYFQK